MGAMVMDLTGTIVEVRRGGMPPMPVTICRDGGMHEAVNATRHLPSHLLIRLSFILLSVCSQVAISPRTRPLPKPCIY